MSKKGVVHVPTTPIVGIQTKPISKKSHVLMNFGSLQSGANTVRDGITDDGARTVVGDG